MKNTLMHSSSILLSLMLSCSSVLAGKGSVMPIGQEGAETFQQTSLAFEGQNDVEFVLKVLTQQQKDLVAALRTPLDLEKKMICPRS